ncbi:MAG TPA: T9SS type A sorting domain-containing protein [Flavobacteriales bacterium]|nr:T9SS type A sorting domain-containing protein [Flavobacteriales bacterium]
MDIRRIILIGFLCISVGQAQTLTPEVVSNSGEFFNSTAGSLSWTLGEPVIETFSNVTSTLTQGFQQSEINLVGTTELNNDVCISVFPNPTSGMIYIQLTNPQHNYLTVTVYSTGGSLISHCDVSGQQEFYTDLGAFPNGTYILTITDKNQFKQSVTIIKK